MTPRQLQQLHTLRTLRHDRAARQLAILREQCEAAAQACDQARDLLADHQAHREGHAHQLHARQHLQMPVTTWQRAQAQLAAMAEEGEGLLARFGSARDHWAEHDQQAQAQRQVVIARERQQAAIAQLMVQAQQRQARRQEACEDDDQQPGQGQP
jgi:hypothetical protein